MTTIVINDKSVQAQKMIEFIKTMPFAKVTEENEPNRATLRSIEDIKTGKLTRTKSVEDLLQKLKK